METVNSIAVCLLKECFEGCVFYKQSDPPIHRVPSVVIWPCFMGWCLT